MNRRTILAFVGAASSMTTLPAASQSQTASAATDQNAVQAWLENCAASWATGDAERMFRMATDDVEWVNIVGMHWRSKQQVVAVHDLYLNTMFKGVPMALKSIESVRSVGPDVVIAVVRWSIGSFSPPDGSVVPAADDRMTLVFRRTGDGLQLVHGANVQIDAVAENFDPSRMPPPPT